jgi:hypothetical protein
MIPIRPIVILSLLAASAAFANAGASMLDNVGQTTPIRIRVVGKAPP